MKVKCIDEDWFGITADKTYEVIKEDNNTGCYIIMNNFGDKLSYIKECFKTISEIRNEKINKLLEE
jgi:hypothetical protein